MFLLHSEKSDLLWAEPYDKFQEQRSDILLEDIVVSESKSFFKITSQTDLDWTKAPVQSSEPVIYVADGSVCTEDAPSQISNIDYNIVDVYCITGNPFEYTRIESSISFDCWPEKNAVTKSVSPTPDDRTFLRFGYVSPIKETVRGRLAIEVLASLLAMSNMPQTDNRTTEVSESNVAVASNEEKAYVTDRGVSTWKRHLSSVANLAANVLGIRSCDGFDYDRNRWIERCIDVEPLGRGTRATSEDRSFSQEADRSFSGIDMVVRRPAAGHISVDSSLFHDIIAFMLVAPISAFVITSWGMIDEFPLCTRDHSVRLLLGPIRAPAIAKFMLATVIYSITTTVYSLRRHNESLQGEVSSVVLILSAIGGLWLNCDLQIIVLCIFPWAIIVALLLSSGLHSITWISRYSADLKAHEYS